MQRVLVFADDLTGALEVGALGVARGWKSSVQLLPVEPPETETFSASEVRVLDTAARELSESMAVQRLEVAAELTCREDLSGTAILKKTDSLLRGHVAAELACLRRSFPERPLVFAPAYPLLGRCVMNGLLHLAGPLATASVPNTRDVAALLQAGMPGVPIRMVSDLSQLDRAVSAHQSDVLLCDGASQPEVDAMAGLLQSHLHRLIVAGSAGIFREILPRRPAGAPLSVPEVAGSGLGLVGSQHPVTLAQLNALESRRVAIVLRGSPTAEEIQSAWADAIAGRRSLFIHSGDDADWELPLRRAARVLLLADCAEAPKWLYCSGGETAACILREMGLRQLHPVGELIPGIVLSQIILRDRNIAMITKSGAFGERETLANLLRPPDGKTVAL